MASVLAPITRTHPGQYLYVDGYKITFSTAGPRHAPAILLLHGWTSHRGIWQQTVNALKAHYFCVSIDLLGFGDSDKPTQESYSIAQQARRILAVADGLGITHFTLIGHSMGGQVSTYIAAILAPERVDKLVSVAGVVCGRLQPYVRRITYPMVWLGYKLPFLYALSQKTLLHFRPFAYVSFRPWFHKMNNPPFAHWHYDREMAFQRDIHAAMYHAGRAIHACDLRPHLSKIFAPTLAIFGAQDGTVPPSDGEIMARQVPGADLVMIDACGHFPMYEKPTLYLKALVSFLERAD